MSDLKITLNQTYLFGSASLATIEIPNIRTQHEIYRIDTKKDHYDSDKIVVELFFLSGAVNGYYVRIKDLAECVNKFNGKLKTT